MKLKIPYLSRAWHGSEVAEQQIHFPETPIVETKPKYRSVLKDATIVFHEDGSADETLHNSWWCPSPTGTVAFVRNADGVCIWHGEIGPTGLAWPFIPDEKRIPGEYAVTYQFSGRR